MSQDVIESINAFKRKLTSAAIPAFPQSESHENFRVYTEFGLKAVAIKIAGFQFDKEANEITKKTMLYDLKLLNETQPKYCSNKGELYTILWYLSKHNLL